MEIVRIHTSDKYYVSEYGDVFRKLKDGTLKPLKPYSKDSKYGKNRLRVRVDGKIEYVYRLVCDNFVCRLDETLTVNHKDGNPLNNHMSNLEAVPLMYNIYHSVLNGLSGTAIEVYEKSTGVWLTFLTLKGASEFFEKNIAFFSQRLLKDIFECEEFTVKKIIR